MFCYQCQETVNNTGCTKIGVCGKKESTSNLQDLLIFVLQGIATYVQEIKLEKIEVRKLGRFAIKSLFTTITNANFDDSDILERIQKALSLKEGLIKKAGKLASTLPEAATWTCEDVSGFSEKAKSIGVLLTENEDIRSLRQLLIYGVKGISAYADHAYILGYEKDEIYNFIFEAIGCNCSRSFTRCIDIAYYEVW
jgi:hydroxylamine reductase